MRRALVLAIVVAASGCAARGRVQGPGFANGTRLAARWDELDGLRVLRSFFDSARGEECAFRVVPGGAACLPASAQRNGWFTDSNCTDEIVEIPPVDAGRTPPQSLVDDPVDACTQAPTVHALGPQFPTADAWFRKSDGSCGHGSGGTRPATLRRIGDEVPLDAFVHATVAVQPVASNAGRIGTVVFVGDDGTHFSAFGWDAARADWAAPAVAEDGTRRWWPARVAFNYGAGTVGTPGTVFADGACTQPTGVKEAHDALCPIGAVVEFVPSDACTQFTTRLHAAGAPVASDQLFAVAGDGSCVPDVSDGGSDALYVTMGDVLPADQFATVTSVDVGSGRVVARFDGTPDGDPITPSAAPLYDRARALPCAVATAADGARRCLPAGTLDLVEFADAACTTRIFPIGKNVACANDPVAPPEVTWNGHAFAVAGAVQPAMIYDDSGGSCAALGPSPDYDRWFALGDEIAPSAYAPASLRTE